MSNGGIEMNVKERELLSEQNLEACLEDLRGVLLKIGIVLFFDLNSFYQYIDMYLHEYDVGRITRLIGVVEPYIPIAVSDDEIDNFLAAAMDNDAAEVERLEREFVAHSKMKFIRDAISMDDGEWGGAVEICQTIRRYKEEGIRFTYG
jgi:hypothetical protein